ncbi:MAG: hypothetical protein ACXVED_02520 [Bacteroidia bacterium]
MEQTKQRLTSLINNINESFPDENDLKGYAGISKALITDMLTGSSTQLIGLKDYDNHFEAIIMKRELAELFDKVTKELKIKFDKMNFPQFNSILKSITKIKFLISETYISLINSGPIRTEEEILKAKEELKSLNSNIEDLKKITTDLNALKDSTIQEVTDIKSELTTLKESLVQTVSAVSTDAGTLKESLTKTISDVQTEAGVLKDSFAQNIANAQTDINALKDTTVKDINIVSDEIKSAKETAATTLSDFETKQKSATESEQKINDFLAIIETHKKNVELIEKNTTQWQEEIEDSKKEISENTKTYETLNTKSKALNAEIETTHEKIFGKKDEEGKAVKGYLQETEDLKNKIATFLSEQDNKFKTQFSEIESLLPGATSTGLAEAYLQQKLSYKNPIRLWSGVFISTIILMAALSLWLICLQISKSEMLTLDGAFISLLRDLTFFIPTIWLAGYASKKQSQYKRLQQEYAFKETNAKSFHGHKVQIEALMKEGDADQDLLKNLMAQLIIITSQNPSLTLDNKSHEDNSPILKLMENFTFKGKKDNKD